MGKFIFILGGVKSGKSRYAVNLAKSLSEKVAIIATAAPSDKEMEKRIKLHKASRPQSWKTIEENKDIESVIRKLNSKSFDVVLIDCLGLLISNLLLDRLSDNEIEKILKKLRNTLSKSKSSFTIILVSNNAGSGVVPANPLARRFSDLIGLANQMMAKGADRVIFMQAGIPIIIKSNAPERELCGAGKKSEVKAWKN